jgi:hypothetical protein
VAPLLPEGIENLRQVFRQLEFKSLEARLDALLENANRA